MPMRWRQCPVVLAVLWASSAEAVDWSIAVGTDVGQTRRGVRDDAGAVGCRGGGWQVLPAGGVSFQADAGLLL
jgi:hypothetical protein